MDGKKISFGFKQKLKPANLVSVPITKKPDHQLIECLEGSTIKIIGKEEEKPKLLVIPLKSDNNATKRISTTTLKIIQEEQGAEPVEDAAANSIENTALIEPNNETLEQKAAREIIASITQVEIPDETKIFTLPIKADELPLDGASESTIDDYENIPIRDFGLAMLRGMGWKDEEKKANELKLPPLRPKGMGLGADKMAKPKDLLVQPAQNEVLEIKKNAYVKIITGKQKNLYGQIEGLDDDTGRVNVVMSIGGSKVSLNEFTVQVVTKEEWIKYGKILNSVQYEDYKNKDVKPEISKEKTIKTESPADRESERQTESKYNKSSKSSGSHNDNSSSSSRRNYVNDENGSKTSSTNDKHKQSSSRSTSSSKYYQHKSRHVSTSSSDDTDSEKERRERHKKSSKSKKSYDRRSRSRSKSRERHRRYSSEESSDDQKYHHKKKTKKSKKPRSRSRTRR